MGIQIENMFPRGLRQPQKGFRFSVDALLLSTFISPGANSKIADIGCGCGVVGLGILLNNPGKNLEITGIDHSYEMIDLAGQNALLLSLGQNYFPLKMDVVSINSKNFSDESFDLVVSNPPYRDPDSGRIPENHSKHTACFSTGNILEDFIRACFFLLKNKGKAAFVFDSGRLDVFISMLKSFSLEPKKILPVYGKAQKSSKIFLLEARKNAKPGLELMAPLILHDDENKLTQQAVKFCPFLCSTSLTA
ncbi:MAG: methyltransferase, partial [Desulfovibrionales bacterium]|nr:methyltransferase [Desulfovibrionales bacterium]